MSAEALRSAFSFTEEDLKANDSGYLTHAQKEMIRTSRKQQARGFRLATSSIVITIALLLGLYILFMDNESSAFWQALPFYAGTCALLGLVYAFFAFLGYHRARDVRSGSVSTVEGEVRTWSKEYRTGTGYFAEVGGIRFRLVSEEQMTALSENMFYRIHYVRNLPVHLILSLRVIG